MRTLKVQTPLASSMSGDRKSPLGGNRVEQLNSLGVHPSSAASVLPPDEADIGGLPL
jgi:hypothetical protein